MNQSSTTIIERTVIDTPTFKQPYGLRCAICQRFLRHGERYQYDSAYFGPKVWHAKCAAESQLNAAEREANS